MKNQLEQLRSKFTMTVQSRRLDGDEAAEQKTLYIPILGIRYHLYWAVAISSWNDSNRKNNWFVGVEYIVKFPNETIIFNMDTRDNTELQEAPWQEIFANEMDYLKI